MPPWLRRFFAPVLARNADRIQTIRGFRYRRNDLVAARSQTEQPSPGNVIVEVRGSIPQIAGTPWSVHGLALLKAADGKQQWRPQNFRHEGPGQGESVMVDA